MNSIPKSIYCTGVHPMDVGTVKEQLQNKLKYNIHTYQLTKIHTNCDIKVHKLRK
jgi:hypothetical protein